MYRSIAMLIAITISLSSAEREVLVSVMCWNTPLGSLNGARQWQVNGYNYERQRSGESAANYPLPPDVNFPRTLVVGTDEYYALQYKAALIDLARMKGASFDTALFDMLPMPIYDPSQPISSTNAPLTHFRTFLEWLRAAEVTGMKAGIFADVQNKSGDHPQGYKLNTAEWTRDLIGAVDAVKDAKALWRIGEKPAVIHFGASIKAGNSPPVRGAPEPDGGWRSVLKSVRDAGREFYFIADIRPLDADIQAWNSIADAVYSFAPAGPKNYFADIHPYLMEKIFTVPFMWVVSPGYYNPGLRAYTEPDFERIHRTYTAAMKANASKIQVLTWNDFGEDTDIAPSANKGDCLLTVFGYYNRWFKSGIQPKADTDTIIIAYPVAIPANVQSKPPAWGDAKRNQEKYAVDKAVTALSPAWGDWIAPAYSPKIFYWANIRTSQTLSVNGTSITLPQGLSMGELGTLAPGPVAAVIGEKTVDLPPVIQVSDERESGLRFRYVNLSEPLPPHVLGALKIRPIPSAISENFESFPSTAAWIANNRGGFRLSGEDEFLIAENPVKDEVDPSERCLRIYSPQNTPRGLLTIRFATMPEGKFSFKVYSPRPNKIGPPYGNATWYFKNSAGLFSGDIYEYLSKCTAGTGEKEPFGGYTASDLGKLDNAWHTVSGGWSSNGRVNMAYDGVERVVHAPLQNALDIGVKYFSLASADVLDGKRSSDVYIDDIMISMAEK